MKKSRLPIAVLLVVVALADLAVALRLEPTRTLFGPPSETTLIVAEALAASQVGLVAVWLVLGGGRFPAACRLAALWLVVVLFSRLLRSGAQLADWELLSSASAVIFLTQILATAVPLWALRYAGLMLEEADRQEAAPQRLQFSVRALVMWTAGLAVFLVMLSYAVGEGFLFWRFFFGPLPPFGWLELAKLGLGHAAIALAGLPVVLDRRRPVVRTCVLLGLAGGTVWVSWLVAGQVPTPATPPSELDPTHRFWLLMLLEAWLVVACLWPVRLSGLRLAWRGHGTGRVARP